MPIRQPSKRLLIQGCRTTEELWSACSRLNRSGDRASVRRGGRAGECHVNRYTNIFTPCRSSDIGHIGKRKFIVGGGAHGDKDRIVESPTVRHSFQFLKVKRKKMPTASSNSWLSSQYVNGIYIPSGLLLLGIAIVKVEWLPYAAAVAVLLGSWKIYRNRKA